MFLVSIFISNSYNLHTIFLHFINNMVYTLHIHWISFTSIFSICTFFAYCLNIAFYNQ